MGSCGNCVFPFIYNGTLITSCTTIDGDTQPWCATSVVGQGYMTEWEYCTDPSCPGLDICGNCVFPFIYEGTTIDRCTTIDGDQPWCATSVDGKGTMTEWEYCTDPSCPSGCLQCKFPFISAGRLHDRCTTIDGDRRPWCANEMYANGTMKDSTYCTDPSCPGLEGNSEQMSVHPKNDVGNCCKLGS